MDSESTLLEKKLWADTLHFFLTASEKNERVYSVTEAARKADAALNLYRKQFSPQERILPAAGQMLAALEAAHLDWISVGKISRETMFLVRDAIGAAKGEE